MSAWSVSSFRKWKIKEFSWLVITSTQSIFSQEAMEVLNASITEANSSSQDQGPVSPKPRKLFGPRNVIFSSSVSKNGEGYTVCTSETSCIKGTSVHIKNVWIKQLCNRKVRHFAMTLRTRRGPCLEGPEKVSHTKNCSYPPLLASSSCSSSGSSSTSSSSSTLSWLFSSTGLKNIC